MSFTHYACGNPRWRSTVTALLAVSALLLAASPALAGTTAARPLSKALRVDGSLRHVHGSFYAHGYRLVLGSNGAPRFIKMRPAARAGETRPAPTRTKTSSTLGATAPADASWSENLGISGLPAASSLSAVAVSGPNVYVGGSFSTISRDAGIVYNNVAWWDGHAWRPLGAGTDGEVKAIAVSGPTVYVGGAFTSAGGAPASAIARWNGTAWFALGLGMTDPTSGGTPSVNALALSGPTLYAGGNFDDAGTATASSLASWDGASWSALRTGVQACVFFDQPNHCFNAPADGTVSALALSGSKLYVGGSFNLVGGVERFGLASFSGNAWSSVGGLGVSYNGGEGQVDALALNGSILYAGGHFDHVGGSLAGSSVSGAVPAASVASFNGSTWSPLGSGANTCSGCGSATVTSLAYWSGKLFMSGKIYGAGDDGIPLVGQWNGSAWSGVGSLDGSPTDSSVLTATPSGVVAAGTFRTAGGGATVLNYVGLWSGTAWSGYGSGIASSTSCCGSIAALAASNHDVYAAGGFATAGWSHISSLAHFNGTAWSPMGSGLSGGLAQAFAITVYGNDVFVAGNFTQAGGVAASNVAMWDGSTWHALGSGLDSTVYALMIYNGKLWAGGGFTHTGGTGGAAVSEVATWNLAGGGWSAVGGDPNYDNGAVHALAGVSSPYNHYVVIGGEFTQIDDGAGGAVATNGLAMFDTAATITKPLDGYSVFPGSSGSVGVTSQCFSSTCAGSVDALYADGTKLYVGGSFDDAGAVATRSFARYDLLAAQPNGWSSPGTIGGGNLSGTVAAITKVGSNLYVAGDFTTAGTATASAIAQYNPATGWAPLGSGMQIVGSSSPSVSALAQSADGLYAGGTLGTAGGKASENLALWTQTSFSTKVSEAANPAFVNPDSQVTFTSTIRNGAAAGAAGVTLTDVLPSASAQYVSAAPSQGTCSTNAKTLTCALGTIAAGASATVAITLTPVAPGVLSNSVSVRQTGSSNSAVASASATVTAAAGTSYVSVHDSGFSPTVVPATPGQKVQFNFYGPGQHSAIDAGPLALFDSGLKSAVSDYAYLYTAAGTYQVNDAGSANTATVSVRDLLTPGSLTHGSPVTVRISSAAPASGYVLDLQVLVPGSPTWTTIANGVSTPTVTYAPPAAGSYQLRSRLRSTGGAASAYSPAVTLTAT